VVGFVADGGNYLFVSGSGVKVDKGVVGMVLIVEINSFS